MEESNPLNLLSMNMCSPMVVYVVFALVIGCGIYMTRSSLNKYNNNKMNNLFNYHSLQEVKLLVVLGATIYGLCQYNQVNLAWIFLIFPIIYLMLRNILVFVSVSNARQNEPKHGMMDPSYVQQVRQEQNNQNNVNEQQQQQQQQQQQHGNTLRNEISNSSSNSMGMAPPLNSGAFNGTPIGGLDNGSSGGGAPF